MEKSKEVDPEVVNTLSIMFPGVHRDELSNFLKENGFDQAVELLEQIYPPNQGSDDQKSDYDYQSDNDDDIQAMSDSIPLNDKEQMIKEIQKDFPDFDNEICIVFLEDSKFDIIEAKKEALITHQQMKTIQYQTVLKKLKKSYPNLKEEYLSNVLEAAGGDYSMANALIADSLTPDKKPKKKQVLYENVQVSYTTNKKKQKKFKKKSNIPIKSTEKQLTCEFSDVNSKMKYEAQIVQLSEMFSGRDKNLTRDDYEEALNLTNCDIDRAAVIISQKIESFELNECNSKHQDDSNNSKLRKSNKIKELVQLFPQTSSSELEDVLHMSSGNLKIASEIMLNRISENPEPEDKLCDRLFEALPNEDQDDDDNDNDDVDVDLQKVLCRKHTSPSTSIAVNKTNRNHVRPSQHGRTETQTIDLHGCTCADAQIKVTQALDASKYNKVGSITFITGKGQHTKNHVSVLRPFVLTICKERGFTANIGSNRGVVVCHIV